MDIDCVPAAFVYAPASVHVELFVLVYNLILLILLAVRASIVISTLVMASEYAEDVVIEPTEAVFFRPNFTYAQPFLLLFPLAIDHVKSPFLVVHVSV